MPLTSPKDLFQFDLSGIYDGERATAALLQEMLAQVQDQTLAQLLHMQQQETRQQMENLERCFELLGSQPQQVACAAIEGIHQTFHEVCRAVADKQSAPEMIDLSALAGTMQAEHYQIAAYRALVDKAILLGETECAELLQTNLLQDEETAGTLERVNHEMSRGVFTAG